MISSCGLLPNLDVVVRDENTVDSSNAACAVPETEFQESDSQIALADYRP
jgi:hypothetical protein